MHFQHTDSPGGQLIVCLFLSLFLLWCSIAVAQDSALIVVAEIEGADQAYALALAQVAVNEGRSTERDITLHHQAASHFGRNSASRLAWLRCHSRKVLRGCDRDLRERVCRQSQNCFWTRNLRWSDEQPAGFPATARWYPRAWERVREYALRLARGVAPQTVCDVPIVSWGRRSDFDDRDGALIPIECGASNLGATTPGILARARERRQPRSLALANDSR